MMKSTWVKILEYASSPLHGTMSRKLRKGVRLQIGEDKIYTQAVIFIGDKFVRMTANDPQDGNVNSYYDLDSINSIRTYSQEEKS
jgi:hypothetical protein